MVDKVLSRERLVEVVAAERQAGRSLAFANGCFDLLHVGHIRYLQAAAAEADRLIVAVNDDEAAGAKGPGRPILPAAARAELVAALRGVSYVTIFHEPTVTELLLLLRPDVRSPLSHSGGAPGPGKAARHGRALTTRDARHPRTGRAGTGVSSDEGRGVRG